MKIGLLDVDNIDKVSKFPNIALMKLSSYHKNKGDQVGWWDMFGSYDVVYVSKVFDFTLDPPSINNSKKVIYGGIAYGLGNKLPYEVEHTYPDYDLYNTKKAYGYMTRGCPRNCGFCNVTQHQGNKAIKTADVSEFWSGQKEIILLDPNMFACKEWKVLSQQLIDSEAKVDFSQGIDIRVMTKEKISYINKINCSMLHFAWDNYEFNTYEKLKKYRDLFNYSERNMRVYVLVNYNTTHEQDLDRIYKLRELRYDPYVMVFNKAMASKKTKMVQRWVNSKFIWRSCKTFEEYSKPKKEDIKNQQTLF